MGRQLTWADIEAEAWKWEGRGPRLASYVIFINEHFQQYEARIEPCSHRSERKLFAHVSSYGKRREGNGLVVYNRHEKGWRKPVYEHNPLEPYRRNSDVANWIWQHKDESTPPQSAATDDSEVE